MSPLRLGLAAAAALGAATYLALGTGPLLRWLAATALLLALCQLRPWRRLSAAPRLRAAAPHLLLAVLALVLLGEFLLGHPPASRDHAIHYFQTELLVHDLLPAGHLRGWSDRLGNGYTLGDAYPVLGYLWMGAVHLLTLGLVPLRASYALGVLAMWLLATFGVWRLAAGIAAEVLPRATALTTEPTTAEPSAQTVEPRATARATTEPAPAEPSARLAESSQTVEPRATALTTEPTTAEPSARPVPWIAWAGSLGAAFWLLDVGASREGGWEYLMFHGVWPQLLATALWVASLPATLDALRAPTLRRLALAGGLLGLAVLAHPFALLMAGSSALAFLVLVALRPPSLPPAGSWRVLLAVHTIAALLCAGWVAGFLASADTLGRTPVPWLPWGELATQLVAGELFEAHRAWVGPLALLGLALALRRGAALAWLTAGLLIATLVLASDAALTVLRLDLLVSAFKNVQAPRYAILLKPLWFALAGVGAVTVTLWARHSRHLQQSPTPGQNSPQESSTRSQNFPFDLPTWTACILLAPLLAATLEDLGRLLPAPLGHRHTLETNIHGPIEAELRTTLAAEQTALAAPVKIAFLRGGMTGATYPLFAIADLHASVVLDGHIPSINTPYRIRERSPTVLRALGVTHVLHDKKLPKREKPLVDALDPVAKIGPYTLARLTPGPNNPRLIPGLATWTATDLEVTATRHDPHAIDLDVTAAAPLNLLAVPDRNWRATFIPVDESDANGAGVPRPLELKQAPHFGGALTGTRVTLPGPGRLELRYTTPPRERALGWLSLLAALATLAALASRRPLQFAERLHGPAARRLSRILTAATAALLLAFVVRRQAHQLARTWDPVVPAGSFVADLVDTGAYAVTTNPPDTCDGMSGRDAHRGCSPARDRPRRATYFRDPYIYRCLMVTVPARGRTTVTFTPPPDTKILGLVQRRTPGGKPTKKLTLTAGKSRPASFNKDRAERFTAPIIELTNTAADPEQVCLTAAAHR